MSCETSFVISKTGVAFSKKITLHTLELLWAPTAGRLGIFKIMNENIFYLSDSQIVLHSNKGSASNWKSFLENSVREIQNCLT